MTVDLYRSELLERDGFSVHGFSKTTGGVSRGPYRSLNLAYGVGDDDAKVARNLRILKKTLGVGVPLARVRQVHGIRAVSASDATLGDWTDDARVEADAIVSKAEVVVAVQTADCAAVLLADPDTRVVAAVHAGWRGAGAGVVRNAVRAMGALGASPGRIIAVIGPHICMSCYEVGEEVARRLPESSDPIPGRPGKYRLDLANAVEVSLIVSGVASSRIERIPACTSCQNEVLFSYRRSGGTCGRMMGFISPSDRV
jgi:polyphenol oxidase